MQFSFTLKVKLNNSIVVMEYAHLVRLLLNRKKHSRGSVNPRERVYLLHHHLSQEERARKSVPGTQQSLSLHPCHIALCHVVQSSPMRAIVDANVSRTLFLNPQPHPVPTRPDPARPVETKDTRADALRKMVTSDRPENWPTHASVSKPEDDTGESGKLAIASRRPTQE